MSAANEDHTPDPWETIEILETFRAEALRQGRYGTSTAIELAIHWLSELDEDRDRLEWVVRTGAEVAECVNGEWSVTTIQDADGNWRSYEHEDWRKAINIAMQAEYELEDGDR